MSGLAEEEIDVSPLVRYLRIGAGAVLAVAAVVALVMIVQGLMGAGSKAPARQVTKITVLDTPPPPPPPPKEEPKREPPKESPKEVKLEQPKPVEQAPQEAQQLKMEGQAGNGPSAFASGSVTQDYVGGPTGTGTGGGTLQYAFFTNALQRHIQSELARNRKVKGTDYRVPVSVWIASDGAIQRAELGGTTGSADADEALRSALLDLGPLRTAVPPNLPQPVRLRVSNRITG